MTTLPYVLDFSQLDTSDLPDPHGLTESLQMFWVLTVAKKNKSLEYLSANQIADILRDCLGIEISRQKIVSFLSAEKGTVTKKKINKKLHFKIMQKGEDLLLPSTNPTIYMDPENAFSGIKQVETILKTLKGSLKFCDPYVDPIILVYLAKCSSADRIKLLTAKVKNPQHFRRDLGAFNSQHNGILEVRELGRGILHDRYCIHKKGLITFGTSFNGLGKKQSVISEIGEKMGQDIKRAVETAFDKFWNQAAPFN